MAPPPPHPEPQPALGSLSALCFTGLSELFPDGLPANSLVVAVYDQFCEHVDGGVAIDPEQACHLVPSEYRAGLTRALQTYQFAHLHARDQKAFPKVGEVFAGCHLLEVLGTGSFGTVFLARMPKLGDREVVAKVSAMPDIVAREAQTQGRLQHPNIVATNWVHEDTESTLSALVMPYEGRATLDSLRQVVLALPETPASAQSIVQAISDAKIGTPDALPVLLEKGTYFDGIICLAEQMARALAYLHAQKVEHRDLKPSNVLVTPAGRAQLMDFNLSADARLGAMLMGGTLLYMAPEHLQSMDWAQERRGEQALDHRADLFSFGVILYELLARRHPFCDTVDDRRRSVLYGRLVVQQRQGFTPLRELCPQGDESMLGLIERCLALNPEDRPQSAAEVADALTAFVKNRQRELEAPPAPAVLPALDPQPLPRRRARRVVAVALTAVAACLLVAVGVLLANMAPRLEAAPDHFALGAAAYEAGDFAGAVEHFTDELRANPQNWEALFARGRAYQQWGETEKIFLTNAANDYTECGKHLSWNCIPACQGYVLQRNGHPGPATSEYVQAINSGFRTATVYNNLGVLLSANTLKYPDAFKYLSLAIDQDNQLASAYQKRAYIGAHYALKEKGQPATEKADISPQLITALEDMYQALHLRKNDRSLDLYRDAAFVFGVNAVLQPASSNDLFNFLVEVRGSGVSAKQLELLYGHPALKSLTTHVRFAEIAQLPTPPQAKADGRLLYDPLHGQLIPGK